MHELKPCPFCGDAFEFLVIARDWYRVAHPENDLCPLGGHDYTYAQTAQGLKTLQEDWNRRAIPVDQVLVPRELLERVCADRSLLPGHNMAINAIDELRAILQR